MKDISNVFTEFRQVIITISVQVIIFVFFLHVACMMWLVLLGGVSKSVCL